MLARKDAGSAHEGLRLRRLFLFLAALSAIAAGVSIVLSFGGLNSPYAKRLAIWETPIWVFGGLLVVIGTIAVVWLIVSVILGLWGPKVQSLAKRLMDFADRHSHWVRQRRAQGQSDPQMIPDYNREMVPDLVQLLNEVHDSGYSLETDLEVLRHSQLAYDGTIRDLAHELNSLAREIRNSDRSRSEA
jgi:hypothetical protein